MSVEIQYKLISGISISPDHSIGETTMFPEAFDQTLSCYPDPVSANHVTPYILPRSNVTFKSKGFAGWYAMLFSLWKILRGG
ncbi:MAG: hypothetical protein U9N07_02225 [Euryarchaeota archaeon]|nr:hypothetical protein [Euryarchaeota archaeon]